MKDLAILVDNKNDSTEAQDLLFSMGYKWRGLGEISKSYFYPKMNKYFIFMNKNEMDLQMAGYFAGSSRSYAESRFKEITLPQLRDLVVLKRNDVGDANAFRQDNDVKYYITSDNKYYYFSNIPTFQWTESCNDIDYLEKRVKPIEKPMKEYLRKNSNGTYSYIGTVRPEHVSDFMIEIPEGSNIAVIEDSKVKFYSKYTSADLDHLGKDLIWMRPSHPEELPFIDDEPSLNDQYAEIEKVRQSHRTASEIADSALKHIRERAETYDQPTGERSAAKTAKAFNAITGKDITESEVWLLLQLLKDVRQWSREDYHQDSAEDCIAYAALKAESLEGGE